MAEGARGGGGGGWFQFGFCFGKATEAGLEVAPLLVGGEAGPVRCVRPSWSFSGIVRAGGSPPVLLQGAVCAALPEDCRDVLPSETHVLVLREAAVESWPVEGSALVLEGEPAWRCEILPGEAATVGRLASWPWAMSMRCCSTQRGPSSRGEAAEAGDLYVWGWNEMGQLALPSKSVAESRATTAEVKRGNTELSLAEQEAAQGPCKAAFISIQAFPALLDMPDGADVCKISCGSRHTAAVTCTGELYTWGWGKYGQLGHGQTASSDEAKRVSCFVDWGLRVVDVVCGPWTTYVHAVAQ
uniref:RCC1 domain-containing protein 1 isoform X5 n=1 Tax=Podarcis muralis TaxID=64176 RepID=UPI00109F7889|nr:RCC1 domain-containing protein 1 isoform X5 [Podarcis muralis]